MLDPLLWTQYPGSSCSVVAREGSLKEGLAPVQPTEVHQECPSHQFVVFGGGKLSTVPVAMRSTHFPSHQLILHPIWSLLAPKEWVEGLWEKTYID